ncbi:MAG: HEPN domain-containing protein [Candidatus Aenigmarchaeota archaeon]|nr:HEPN domain-containing protein [Candidatus Aenigmarchaeota archaeon]
MRPEIEIWIRDAEDTLDAAIVMFKAEKYNYTVFLSHQVIEKVLKFGIMAIKRQPPSKEHNLVNLMNQLNIKMDKQTENFIRELNPHYIVTRYPDAANGMPAENYNREIAEHILKNTEKVLLWMKNRIKRQ